MLADVGEVFAARPIERSNLEVRLAVSTAPLIHLWCTEQGFQLIEKLQNRRC
jgi:hypothetical protein